MLANEHVPKVASAIGALDLDAHAVRVGQAVDGARRLLIEGRPAAPDVELCVGAVQLGVTAPADVNARLVEVVVLPA